MTAEAVARWWVHCLIGGLLATALVGSCVDVAAAAMQAQALDSLRVEAVEAATRKGLLTSAQRKVESHIRRYSWPEAMAPALVNGPLASSQLFPWRDGGRLHVIVKVIDTAPPAPAALQAAGLEIEIVNDRFGLVQGWIAEAAVPALADLPIVESVSPAWPAEHSTGSVTSQGDHASRADLVRQLGYDGTGVTAGVISGGIDSLANSQATGDLASVTVPPGCQRISGDDEGTAMLEIVHDLAPGASLLFSSDGNTSLGFIEAVNCLRGAGADIIVDDVVLFQEPFFEDGPVAMTATAAVAAGVSYHTSAANYGDGRYLADDYRPGPNGFHDFDPGPGQDIVNRVIVSPGQQLLCFLQWADPFGGSSNDYDLFVVDPVTGTILAPPGDNPQTGSQNPQEAVQFINPLAVPVEVGIAILKVAGLARPLKLLCPQPNNFPLPELQYSSSQFGISGHAARPEVITVAAINANDPRLDTVEAFSMQGPAPIFFPTRVDRPKPDLAGFDGVVTTLPPGGLNPFFGTSAAAPHSAAVAALLLSKNPTLSPAQVQSILTSTAVDIEAPGFDNVAGYGRLDALAAINAVSIPTTTTSTTIPSARCATGSCDDGNPCTDDMCDPATGCQHAANTASCSDGSECTLADQCNGGHCQSGPSVTAGTLSTFITAGVNASLADCRNDKRKQVKKVVNPLTQAGKAFSRAEVAGVGTKKWTKQVAKGEKMIGTARSKLTKVEAKLSSACVSQLGDAIRTGALGDTCLR
jgi:subtilisin family serine protease